MSHHDEKIKQLISEITLENVDDTIRVIEKLLYIRNKFLPKVIYNKGEPGEVIKVRL